MKDFVRVFKILYRNQNAVGKEINTGKRRLPQNMVMLLSMLPLVALICVMLGFLTTLIKDKYSLMAILNVILSGVQMFMLFTMISGILSTLYTAEDNAFLSSLPIMPTSVFFAKFLLVYVNSLKISAAFLLPTLLTVSITYAVSGNTIFYGFYPLILLIVAIAPLLPLFVVTLFSMPLMWLSSFFKGRAVLKTVFSIFFYIVLMAAYMVLIFYFNTSGFGQDGGGISDSALAGLGTLANVMYPNKVMLLFCLGIDAGKNFGIFAAIWAGLCLLAIILALLFYKRVTSRQIESHSEEGRKNVSFKQKSVVAALLKKDFLSVVRNPSMAIGTFANVIMAPIILVAMYFITNSNSEGGGSALANELIMSGFVMMYSLIFLCGTNSAAMLAYTREGESFFISKNLPITAKDSVTAKFIFALAVPLVCLVIIMILCLVLFDIGIVSTLIMAASVVLFCAGISSVLIYFDMKKGNVHWKTQSDLRNSMNGNFASMIPVLIAMIPAVGFLIMSFFIITLEAQLGKVGVLGIYWAVVFAVSAIIAVLGIYILREKGLPLYSKIGETRHAAVKRQTAFGGRKDNFLG